MYHIISVAIVIFLLILCIYWISRSGLKNAQELYNVSQISQMDSAPVFVHDANRLPESNSTLKYVSLDEKNSDINAGCMRGENCGDVLPIIEARESGCSDKLDDLAELRHLINRGPVGKMPIQRVDIELIKLGDTGQTRQLVGVQNKHASGRWKF